MFIHVSKTRYGENHAFLCPLECMSFDVLRWNLVHEGYAILKTIGNV